MKRGLVIVLLLLVGTACGAYHFPGGPPEGTGTVTGSISVTPCSPIQPMPEQGIAPCKTLPPVGLQVAFSSNGTVTSTRTNDSGRYAIDLPEGTYKVSFPGIIRIISGPQPVVVKADVTTTADYVLDSGIRYAA
jgi:hypothetical protein